MFENENASRQIAALCIAGNSVYKELPNERSH